MTRSTPINLLAKHWGRVHNNNFMSPEESVGVGVKFCTQPSCPTPEPEASSRLYTQGAKEASSSDLGTMASFAFTKKGACLPNLSECRDVSLPPAPGGAGAWQDVQKIDAYPEERAFLLAFMCKGMYDLCGLSSYIVQYRVAGIFFFPRATLFNRECYPLSNIETN